VKNGVEAGRDKKFDWMEGGEKEFPVGLPSRHASGPKSIESRGTKTPRKPAYLIGALNLADQFSGTEVEEEEKKNICQGRASKKLNNQRE